MFNPYYPFTTQLLDAFVQHGKTYFVRQTLHRANDPFGAGRNCFLFTHYSHLTTAQDHFGAIGYDGNRFLYDWSLPAHKERLQQAAAGAFPGYRLYAAVFRTDWEQGLTTRLQQKVRSYVSALGWSPKAGQVVDTAFEAQFGELYLRIKYRGRQAKVKFEEIEKLPA